MRVGRIRLWGWVAIAVAGLLLVACGGDGDSGASEEAGTATAAATSTAAATETATPSAPQDLRALLDRVVAAVIAQESARFTLDFNGGTTPLEQFGIEIEKAEGDVSPPERLRAAVEAKAPRLGNIKVEVDIIGIADEAWVTNPFDRSSWLELEGGNPLKDIFSEDKGLVSVLGATTDIRLTGEEEVDGKGVWRIEGLVDSGDLTAFSEDAVAGYEVVVVVWVGKADEQMYRVHLDGRLHAEEPEAMLRRLDLRYGDQIEPIEPPE